MTVALTRNTIGLVFCLSIDLIGSAKAGLKLPTTALDRFNAKLVDQITSHLDMLDLNDALLKFTGDGWLLMTDRIQQLPALSCLATIMAKVFQSEMSAATGISADKVPPLRMAICSGRDLRVKLPDGRLDWVGDSARRAIRASGFCFPNEIVVNSTVREIMFRDFETMPIALSERVIDKSLKEPEEEFPLYVLGGLNSECVVDSDAPECYVSTLSVIGRKREASYVAETVSERLESEAAVEDASDKARSLRRFNRLLASKLDYATALTIVKNLRKADLTPDVFTYNLLINLAPDYKEAKVLLAQMRAELITPDVVSYSTLIKLAPNYKKAKVLFEEMRAELIMPTVITYSTLIKLAPDYEEAKVLFAQMCAELIAPDVVIYNTLINLAPDYEEARVLFEQMRAELITPTVVTYSTLIKLAPDYEEAKVLFAQMRAELITPDVVTYNTLINLAPDYEEAKVLFAQMRTEQITPTEYTYSALFRKGPANESAEDILNWYLAQGFHPEEPLQALISFFRRRGKFDQALRLTLDYPHLEASRSLFRHFGDRALMYFQNEYDKNPISPKAAYALGITLFELGKNEKAKFFLEQALLQTNEDKRQRTLREFLAQLESKSAAS